MALKSTVKTIVEKKIEEYEGRYNHFYLDTKGKVTVGVGHLVANKQVVTKVTMYTTKNNKADKLATVKQKEADYAAVAKQKKKYKASWYKQYTSLIMKDTDINIQRTAHINTFYKELVNMYKKSKGYTTDFDSFPDKVQIALLDMIFNLGATTLRTTFTKFNTAIKSEKMGRCGETMQPTRC